MSPENAKVIASFLCSALESETAATRRVIESLPESKYDWQPHEKGMKAGELAWHIVSAEQFFLDAVLTGEFHPGAAGKAPATIKGILEHYDQEVPALLAKVKELSGEQLAKTITFHSWTNPAVAYINICNVHGIHHRGQLSTYVRSLGEKVPAIYGESADTKAVGA
jgi:uncharacterized damage-inducible protein DinB